jgi:hypothetical protein
MNKEKHDENDNEGMPVPGVPVVPSDKKQDHNNGNDNNNGHGPPVPGLSAVKSNGGSSEYNTNVQKTDTRNSLVHSVFGKHKTTEFQSGYNSTFYNATMPYCFCDN